MCSVCWTRWACKPPGLQRLRWSQLAVHMCSLSHCLRHRMRMCVRTCVHTHVHHACMQAHAHKRAAPLLLVPPQVDNWQFDAFELDEVTQGRPLSTLAFALFKRYSLTAKYSIDEDKLARCAGAGAGAGGDPAVLRADFVAGLLLPTSSASSSLRVSPAPFPLLLQLATPFP